MLLADIVIDVPTKALDRPFTYDATDVEGRIEIGCAVVIRFSNRDALGFVVGLRNSDEACEGLDRISPIESVISEPLFNELACRCAFFLSNRYIAPIPQCLKLFMPFGGNPKMLKVDAGKWELVRPQVRKRQIRWISRGPNFDAFVPKSSAHLQRSILQSIPEEGISASSLMSKVPNSSSALKVLIGRHVLVEAIRDADISDGLQGYERSSKGPSVPEHLTESQKGALVAIEKAMSKANGSVVLVDGVTGSGKTEVYLRSIEKVLESGKQAIVLVPEISLTPQTVSRFVSRFGDIVAVLHSKMGQRERFEQWHRIRSGRAKVVVGARSAIFSPVLDLGLIVIDEEHETSYKHDRAPRYVTRDVAKWLAESTSSTLVLGSATPSIEALHSANTKKDWTHVRLPQRANGRPLPKIEIVDMSLDFKQGNKSVFSYTLKKAILEELGSGHKVVLLLNQRGFAKFLLCRDCGFVPECSSCSTTLTYHEVGQKLVCHHCGRELPSLARCPRCNSPYLKKYGVGTQRVESELREILDAELSAMPSIPEDGARIIRMDSDTTRKKGSHQMLLDDFKNAQHAILLGTQMIAKGLDFEEVTLVGVINADTQLHLPDFRAFERTFDLIEQVAGRAGRGKIPGNVIVQTYEADNIAIRAAAGYDRDMFLGSELPKRKVLRFPPYIRMANVLLWGKDKSEVERAAKEACESIENHLSLSLEAGYQVQGPNPCVIQKERNDYRFHIVVKCRLDIDISAAMKDSLERYRQRGNVNIAIDIDPIDLL